MVILLHGFPDFWRGWINQILPLAQPSLELCAGGKLVVFDDASHWVQRDCAAQVNQEMIAFLRAD